MLRSGRWKYIAYADGVSVPPQLFGELEFARSNSRNLNLTVLLPVCRYDSGQGGTA